jgi:hypothetical protein
MSFQIGNGAVFSLDNLAGALQNLSNFVTNVTLPRDRDTHDTTTLGTAGGARTFIPGLKSATLSIQGKWSPAIDAHLSALDAAIATATFEYGPQGSGTGAVKYSGECWLVKYEPPSVVDGLTEFTAEFQVSGPVTRGTY